MSDSRYAVKPPVRIGERLIVSGVFYAKAIVSAVVWDETTLRYEITLDWGEHGISRVYCHDENKVWERWEKWS